MKKCVMSAACIALMCVSQIQASSTIYDGVIESMGSVSRKEKIRSEDGKVSKVVRQIPLLKIRSQCSPYSSESVHQNIMTRSDGLYHTNNRMLSDFRSYFVDEVPVPMEEMSKILKPGMRVNTFENRAPWYFLYVELRNPQSRTGRLIEVSEGKAVLARPQHQYAKERTEMNLGTLEDGQVVHFGDRSFPPMIHEVMIPENSEVILADGQVHSVELLAEMTGKPVFYQAERVRQRVELIPEGFGAWDVVTQNDSFLGGIKQMEYSAYFVNIGEEFLQTEMNTRPLHKIESQGEKVQKVRAYDAFLLAGWHESYSSGPLKVPTYASMWNVIDGMYMNRDRSAFSFMQTTPGRHVVGTPRRGRMTSDHFRVSSELPAAWGEVISYDEESGLLTLKAPLIEGVTLSGKQTVQVQKDAEFVRLGQPVERESVLKPGTQLKVFAAHPARFFLGEAAMDSAGK